MHYGSPMPSRSKRHRERHRQSRVGWLRASVLGSNDAIVSTSALLMGVAASGADTQALLVAGAAGLVGGAMSMASDTPAVRATSASAPTSLRTMMVVMDQACPRTSTVVKPGADLWIRHPPTDPPRP